MTKENLLEEAKRRYPVGTKCNTKNLGYSCIFTINNANFSLVGLNEVCYEANTRMTYTIYANGKWAEIISKSIPELFPIY